MAPCQNQSLPQERNGAGIKETAQHIHTFDMVLIPAKVVTVIYSLYR